MTIKMFYNNNNVKLIGLQFNSMTSVFFFTYLYAVKKYINTKLKVTISDFVRKKKFKLVTGLPLKMYKKIMMITNKNERD